MQGFADDRPYSSNNQPSGLKKVKLQGFQPFQKNLLHPSWFRTSDHSLQNNKVHFTSIAYHSVCTEVILVSVYIFEPISPS